MTRQTTQRAMLNNRHLELLARPKRIRHTRSSHKPPPELRYANHHMRRLHIARPAPQTTAIILRANHTRRRVALDRPSNTRPDIRTTRHHTNMLMNAAVPLPSRHITGTTRTPRHHPQTITTLASSSDPVRHVSLRTTAHKRSPRLPASTAKRPRHCSRAPRPCTGLQLAANLLDLADIRTGVIALSL